MPSPTISVLTDPVLRVRTEHATRLASLSEVLAMYARGLDFSLPAVRSHQQHPWHAFVCQLAAMALDRAGLVRMPTDPTAWRDLILGLTPGPQPEDSWNLFQDDLTRPAFMQPPEAHKSAISHYRFNSHTPDQIDIIVPASNHEVKQSIALESSYDDWITALVTLQTAAGYPAPFNYGITRMKGGFGNRPCVALTPADQPAQAVRRDVHAIIERSQRAPEQPRAGRRRRQPTGLADPRARLNLLPADPSLVTLLWTVPWDGTPQSQITLDKLHPLFIEVSRRIRLQPASGQPASGQPIRAFRATSRKRRVLDSKENGFLPDPWCPMDTKDESSHSPGSHGTTCAQLVEFLTSPDQWELPPTMRPTAGELNDDCPMNLVTRNLTRGRGKTAGYHEQTYRIGPRTLRDLFAEPPRQQAIDAATRRAKEINDMRSALTESLQMCQHKANAAPKEYRNKNSQTNAFHWSNQYHQKVYPSFFDDLEAELAASEDELPNVQQAWLDRITAAAQAVLDSAATSLRPPAPAVDHSHQRARHALQSRAARIASGS